MSTPVAFIVFNRPETTLRVLAAIRAYRPHMLLVVADGPRIARLDEVERCRAVQAIIDQGVDWPCEVRRCVSAVNLGCRYRLASGIDWVFSQVEEAIILEDDCLPHPSFFAYCDELLARYRDDERVGMISGDQFLPRRHVASYRFSAYGHIWGWASWRRAWRHYDVNLADWPQRRREDWLNSHRRNSDEAWFWREQFDRVYSGLVNTWDYQWTYACWKSGQMAILPEVNLISNIGFAMDATHTTALNHPLANLPTAAMDMPLRHPEMIACDIDADLIAWRNVFRGGICARARRSIARMAWRMGLNS